MQCLQNVRDKGGEGIVLKKTSIILFWMGRCSLFSKTRSKIKPHEFVTISCFRQRRKRSKKLKLLDIKTGK